MGRRGTLKGVGQEGRIKTRLGQVLVSSCGSGGLNLTPDSGRLVNSHRFDSEVKLPSVGICFCLLHNHGMATSWSRNQRRKNKTGFGIIASAYSHRHTHMGLPSLSPLSRQLGMLS